ncbi:MAG: malectin domain-containing carbohydrate-binding protein [Limimaricola soesokkakensis]|uniref:malectin domain-containing carbohydrate-binding protein n=1 Tax=Limimaricola soesokkakensis TaxID=1343159 RepID=UPI0040597A83
MAISPTNSTETIVYRVNAGSTDVAAIDGGPVWTGDLALENGTGPVSVTGDVEHEFTSKSTDSEAEVTYTDPAVADYAPWQLFVHERHDKIRPLPNDDEPLSYNFDVETGATYKITLLYVENWTGAFRAGNDRIFDVTVDGTAVAEFADMNPLGEAAAALGQELPSLPAKMSAKQPFLGTVITRELVYTAVDEELNLAFVANSQNPKINAIQISQILEMPSEIELSATQVTENAAGAVVGEVSVADPDGGDAPEITVSDDRFEVVDGMLKLKAGVSLDFEDAYSLPLTLTATGTGGLSLSQDVEIAVQDVAEGRLSAVTNVKEGSNAGETLKGTKANDLIVGLGGKDTLIGRKGDDIMAGGKGADRFVGGKGFDTLDYSDSAKGVTVNLQKGAAKGGDARGDKFKSMEGVIGSDANDKLLGSKAGNVLIGGDGADVLNGRGGKDWADYSGSDAGVTVNLAKRSGVGGDAEGDRLLKIENVHGSTHNDTLTGDGRKNVLVGDDGRDKITGGGGRDKLDGGAGNDRVLGGGGADTFIFDLGNDKLVGGKGRDTVMFDGDFGDYGVTLGKKVIVTFEGDRDVLTGMERLEFDDTTYVREGGNWVELG